jgi:hypothetical protein
MTYACPSWELVAANAKQCSAHHWKFSKVHTGPGFHTAFNLPYVYDYVIKLCRQQAEVINHENEHVRGE